MQAAVGQETEFGRAQPSELVSKPSPRSLVEQIRITTLTDIAAKEDHRPSMRHEIIQLLKNRQSVN